MYLIKYDYILVKFNTNYKNNSTTNYKLTDSRYIYIKNIYRKFITN